MKDPFKVWNGEKFEFTLNKILNIVLENKDYEIPNAFKSIADEVVNRVTADNMPTKTGIRIVFDLSWNKSLEESKIKLVDYIKNGVVVISNRTLCDENNQKLDTIYVKDPWKAWIKLGKYVKTIFPMPTVAITGSTGKTTCTMFAKTVFDEKYKSFISGENGKNFNTPLQIVNQWILRCNDTYNFHIQECGGETPDLIKTAAEIIEPDVFAINNIETTQHIATYKSVDKLIADKTSFDRVAKEGAIGVINIDDPILKKHQFNSKIITYGINNKDADYTAENIRQEGQYLNFDVLHDKRKTPIRINIIGEYNVYNALMVFAMAKVYHLTDEEIQNGFLKYKSIGIRQNLSEISGRYLYMDCYNASVESMLLSVETLSKLNLEYGAKKIAVLSERKTYDENTYSINYTLGKRLAEFEEIDKFVVVGEDSKYIIGDKFQSELRYEKVVYDGILDHISDKSKCEFCTDLKELADRLKYTTKKGDAILFKGRANLALWCIPDLAFGTSFTKADVLKPLGIEKNFLKDGNTNGIWYKNFGGVNLTAARNGFDNTKIILPDNIKGYPIIRIDERCFENNTQLKLIIFGKHIAAIEKASFKNCINIENINLPNKTIHIGEEAFSGCISLSNVYAMEVEHISRHAFKDCIKLKEIYLSERCLTIDAEAFCNCDEDLIICAPENSMAQLFAMEHGYQYKVVEYDEETLMHTAVGTRKYPSIYNIKELEQKETYDASDRFTVSFVGDIMIHDIHLEGMYDITKEQYDFSDMFKQVKPYLEVADIAVGNVETTFGRKNYSSFPKFNSPEILANNLKDIGMDVAACANNHAYDSSYAGILRTKEILEAAGILVTGTKSKKEEKGYVVIEKKGIKVAILNYTYRTRDCDGFRTINTHKMDEESCKLINTFSYDTIDEDLGNINREVNSAREEADIVLVYYHWGVEYDVKSNVLQRYIAYKTAQMGVDAIIGSHPHVIQEKDKFSVTIDGKKKTVPVFYSLGNFCWGGRFSRSGRESVQNGIIAQLSFEMNNRHVVKIDASYVPLHISNEFTNNKFDFSILALDDLNDYEKRAFDRFHVKSIEDISTDIKKTVNNISKTKMYFDNIFILEAGKKINVFEEFFDFEAVNCEIISENPSSVIALDNGHIFARKEGIAGLKLSHKDGEHIEFIVKVIGEAEIELPLLINTNNRMLDIDKPVHLKTGGSFGLRCIMLEEKCALAWNAFRTYAQINNKMLTAKKGFVTFERELKDYIAEKENSGVFGELYGKEIPLGYSEYMSGCILDMMPTEELAKRENALLEEWCKFNAYKFNFVFRVKDSEARIYSLEYVYDKDLAYIIQNYCDSTEAFYIGFNKYMQKYRDYKSRGFKYMSESEKTKGDWNSLTLGKICEIIGTDLPFSYRKYEDLIVPQITMSDINMKKNAVFFFDKTLLAEMARTRNALRKGAITAITDRKILDENRKNMNQIIVEDSFKACAKVCRFILENNGCAVIGIKENSREHILRDMLKTLLELKYKIAINEGTSNGRIHMVNTVQTITKDDDYYIQNIEGAYTNFINENLELLDPAISVVVGLEKNYPKNYMDKNEYLNDVFSIINYAIERNNTIFINIDEKEFNKYKSNSNVISISMKNKSADFYMEYKQNKSYVSANIYSKASDKIINLKINKEYEKHLMQILAAYAVALYIGISEDILANSPMGNMSVLREPSELEKGIKWEFLSNTNTITVKWDKCEDLTGYHIRCYSQDDKFIKGMHVYEGNEYIFKNMKPGTDYKIKVRGYIIINGLKTYGAYMTKNISTKPTNKLDRINFKRTLRKIKNKLF